MPEVTRCLLNEVQHNPAKRNVATRRDVVQGRSNNDRIAKGRLSCVVVQQVRHSDVRCDVPVAVRIIFAPVVGQVVLTGEVIANPGTLDMLQMPDKAVQRHARGCSYSTKDRVRGVTQLPCDQVALVLQEADQSRSLIAHMCRFRYPATPPVDGAATVLHV